MDLDEFRTTIPAANEAAYLNTGSGSPGSVDVVEAMQAFLEHHGYESPAGKGMYQSVYQAFEETQRDVADFLNGRLEEVALRQGTGDGASRVANAIQWDGGDTVVRTELEHPTVVVPRSFLERGHHLNMDVLKEIPRTPVLLDFCGITIQYLMSGRLSTEDRRQWRDGIRARTDWR